jgi:hypothetical protein
VVADHAMGQDGSYPFLLFLFLSLRHDEKDIQPRLGLHALDLLREACLFASATRLFLSRSLSQHDYN